jgi:Na+/H+-dicarboxylate symporter
MFNPFKLKLHWQILLALVLSIAISALFISFDAQRSTTAIHLNDACDFVGNMFLNALKMIVVPLIVSSIITGLLGIGSGSNFGRMGLKTVIYYLVTGLLATSMGLLVVNVFEPGKVSEITAQKILQQAPDSNTIFENVEGSSGSDFAEIFVRMIPSNVFAAAEDNGQLLGVIFFSILFGFFITKLPDHLKEFQGKLWQSIMDIMTLMADLIIRFAPIGVFALATPKIMGIGVDLFVPVAKFFFCVLLGLGLHFFVTLGALLAFVARVNPIDHYKTMAPALLTAFSTASSVSTLPVTIECVEKGCGVSNRIASFMLPLGSTVNMDGTALYECMVVIFIAQFYAMTDPTFHMSLGTQFSVAILAQLTSIGVAGIPSASLVAIAVILGVVGLPLEYISIVLVVDRLLDMCRTSVNIFSDSVGAVVVSRLEGEALQPHRNNF